MITAFMYLSDVESGGETNFPYAGGEDSIGAQLTAHRRRPADVDVQQV